MRSGPWTPEHPPVSRTESSREVVDVPDGVRPPTYAEGDSTIGTRALERRRVAIECVDR